MRAYASSPKPHYGASMKDYHSPSRTPVQAPSPKPHHGASLKDFESPAGTPVPLPGTPVPVPVPSTPDPHQSTKEISPLTRTETPPYPTHPHEMDIQNKPLPSPPASIEPVGSQEEAKEHHETFSTNGDWKEEVCKLIKLNVVALVAFNLCFYR